MNTSELGILLDGILRRERGRERGRRRERKGEERKREEEEGEIIHIHHIC